MTALRDLSPREAWDLLEHDGGARLVDVRSRAEWTFVGVPDLARIEKSVAFVEWQHFPSQGLNPAFLDELAASGVAKNSATVFICRSGGRSRKAAEAALAAGWQSCFNLSGGFEGDLDPAKHRGMVGGWKVAGLPWFQG
ncbi:MAG: rhodanese-like domain-containing protein [Alphaproteobacteria bacterium]|nr:rhodanese-like domain-containing protein [Alphaproteobacteria bacterium]